MSATPGEADLPLVLGNSEDSYPIGPTNYSLDIAREGLARVKFESGIHHASADLEAYECERSIFGLIIQHCRVLTVAVARPELHCQHITHNTGDDEAVSWLTTQYRRCRELHAKCQHLAPYNDFMPTRVLYVGSTEEGVVRLCDGADTVAGAGYTVLSHCWGTHPQRAVLTKSTVDMFKEGIPWSLLSRTFQDAIIVTRKFQIRYIWIDSL